VEEKRGKINVSFITVQDSVEGKALDSFGGAVSTVQSILLRLSIILRRGLKPILLLDESLPAFDPGYIHLMAEFLSTLCKNMGVNILLVTHNPNLVDAAHQSYRISKRGDKAQLDKI
jgi:ABC-type thiamine transport system ATPase subunit